MARSKSAANGKVPNRSDAIREVLAANPKATSKDVQAELGKKGIKVSSTLVYVVKSKLGQAKRRVKQARVAAASRETPAADPVRAVTQVKELARDVGGFRNLKMLVDLLAE